MTTTIDLSSRSDKLLLALALKLNTLTTSACQAMRAWQKLVELEARLDKECIDREEEHVDAETERRITSLKAECQVAACELSKFYTAIRQGLNSDPSMSNLINVVDQRLDKDYRGVLELQDLQKK